MFLISINFSRNDTSSIKPSLSFVTEPLVTNTREVYIILSHKTQLWKQQVTFWPIKWFDEHWRLYQAKLRTLAILCSMIMINEFSCNLIGLQDSCSLLAIHQTLPPQANWLARKTTSIHVCILYHGNTKICN